jgi:hypothetical protein
MIYSEPTATSMKYYGAEISHLVWQKYNELNGTSLFLESSDHKALKKLESLPSSGHKRFIPN